MNPFARYLKKLRRLGHVMSLGNEGVRRGHAYTLIQCRLCGRCVLWSALYDRLVTPMSVVCEQKEGF